MSTSLLPVFKIKKRKAASSSLSKLSDSQKEPEKTNSNSIIAKTQFLGMLEQHLQAFIQIFDQVFSTEEFQQLSSFLVTIFTEDDSQTAKIFHSVFSREITETTDDNTLFRGVSLATKLFAHFTGLTGSSYLAKHVLPFVQSVDQSTVELEVDPSKPNFEERNGDHLMAAVKEFVAIIEGSLDDFRKCKASTVFSVLGEQLQSKSTAFQQQMIGGFFFLRFICPFLVAPKSETLTSAGRRKLILISKILQNMSNSVLFGDKEQYLTFSNDLIDSMRPRIASILGRVSGPLIVAPQRPRFVNTLDNAIVQEAVDELYSLCASREYIITQALGGVTGDAELSASFEQAMQLCAKTGTEEIEEPASPRNTRRSTPLRPSGVRRKASMLLESALPPSPRALLTSSPRLMTDAAKVTFNLLTSPFSQEENTANVASPAASRKRQSPETDSLRSRRAPKRRDTPTKRPSARVDDVKLPEYYCDAWEF